MGANPEPRPWIPVGLSATAIGIAILCDWQAHEFPAHTLRSTVHHPLAIRLVVHGLSLAILAALLRFPRRAWVSWSAALLVTIPSSLATTRLVVSPREPVRVVVAGMVTLNSVALEQDAYYQGRRCYRSLARDGAMVEVNGQRLRPPFLPLPVDWSILESDVIEYKCTR